MAETGSVAHGPTLVSQPGSKVERLAPGTAVGEYVVEQFLGAGAMGEVYAGAHPVIGKRVAIKVLKREVGASPEGAERFKREARAVNQIDHANVIDVFSFGRLDDGRLFLVMDLVEGKSLRKAITDGPLDVDTALAILGQIADALDAAHARGVVHRDLKPDNVMLSGTTPPVVYVLDFGLAKLLSAGDGKPPPSMLTGQGTWLGTPGYMAPEQWSADGAGPASDRYALGVMAFELLSGSLPFEAQSLPQMMEQHFRAKVPALSARGAVGVSSAFDPVLAQAMAKDPNRRFSTGREMVEALRAAAGRPKRASAGSSRPPWVPAIAGAGVLGLSIAAVLVVREQGTRDDTTQPAIAAARPNASERASGMVRLEIYTVPAGAELIRDNRVAGITPTLIDAPPGSQLAFAVRKPGFATIKHTMTVPAQDETLPAFPLQPIRGFEGVWALPSGDLRAFERIGDDRVAVSKVQSVDGEREFFRHYHLIAADQGAVFATTEQLVEPAAPNEPSCHIPQRVEYHYLPEGDRLELRMERVTHDVVDGRCIVKSRAFDPPRTLSRADRHSSTERVSLPPVGLPERQKPVRDKAEEVRKPPAKVPPSKIPPSKVPPSKASKAAAFEDAPERTQQAANPPPNNAPAPSADPPAQDAPPPRSNAPVKSVAEPRGDSQVAPQVQRKK